MGAQSLCRGVRKDCKLHQERLDRDSRGLSSLESLETETGGKAKLDGLGGVFTSHRDMGLQISLENGDKRPWCAPT